MLSLIIALTLSIVVIGLGNKLLKLSKLNFSSIYEEVSYSGGLGFGAFSLIIFFIGLLGLFEKLVIIFIVCSIGIISIKNIYNLSTEFIKNLLNDFRKVSHLVEYGLIFLIAIFLSLNLIGAMAPPNAADALVYHLSIPKLYIKENQLIDIPFNIRSYLPLNIEMLFTAGMLIYSDITAKLLNFVIGVLVLFSIYGFSKRYFNSQIGLIAVAIFLSLPLTTNLITTASTDLGATLFFALTLFSFLIYMENRRVNWLLLASVFAGFTAGTKLQPIFLIISLGGLYLIKILIDTKWRTKKEFILWVSFGVLAILIASPWYIKNIIYTGNPVYPFFYSLFGGSNWSSALSVLQQNAILAKAPGYDLGTFLNAPWRFTVQSANFGDLGFFFLAFLPIAIIVRKSRWLSINILGLAIIYYPLWFYFLFQRHRHWVELAPALSIIVAITLITLLKKDYFTKYSKYLISGIFSLALILGLGISIIYNAKFLPVVSGFEDRNSFLTEHGYIYEPYIFVNEQLPETSKILVYNFWDMTYYLDVDYVIGNPLIQGLIDYSKFSSTEQLLQRLKELGITHIFFRGDEILADMNISNELPNNLQSRSNILYRSVISKYGVEIKSFEGSMVSSKTLQNNKIQFTLRLFKLKYPEKMIGEKY